MPAVLGMSLCQPSRRCMLTCTSVHAAPAQPAVLSGLASPAVPLPTLSLPSAAAASPPPTAGKATAPSSPRSPVLAPEAAKQINADAAAAAQQPLPSDDDEGDEDVDLDHSDEGGASRLSSLGTLACNHCPAAACVCLLCEAQSPVQ